MPSILDLAYKSSLDQVAEAANLSLSSQIAALSQSDQLAKAMTPSPSQISQIAVAANPSLSTQISALSRSNQLAKAMIPSPSQISQMAEAANPSLGSQIAALSQSDQLTKAMTPSPSQMVETIDLPISQRIEAMTRSAHMAKALDFSSDQMIEALATTELLPSDFADVHFGPRDHQQAPIYDDSLSSEIIAFQIQTLAEYIYRTLADDGIRLTTMDLIWIEMMLSLALYHHYPDKGKWAILVSGVMGMIIEYNK